MLLKNSAGELELQEGKLTLRELSLWFGLAPTTISNGSTKSKEKKFNILKGYAVYHYEGRNIIIDKVTRPVYSKARAIVEKEFPKKWGIILDENGKANPILKKERIDTCTRVGKDIYHTFPEVSSQISEKTTIQYVGAVKREQYGRCHVDEEGTKGRCEYVYVNEEGTAPLSPDELAIVKQCSQEAYNLDLQTAMIDEDYHKGKLSKQERDEAISELVTDDKYDKYVRLVITRLGYMPDKRTMLIDNVFKCGSKE